MKKAYDTPTLLAGGDTVQETLNSSNPNRPESVNPLIYKTAIGGSIGFGL
jgi:hypothetical protein